jgi:hypothetical protein
MSSNVYSVGLNNVGSYQVSGMPFASGSLIAPVSSSSPLEISFPYVTQWVQIIPHSNSGTKIDLKVGFSENGVSGSGDNYFRIHARNTDTYPPVYNLKVSKMFFQSDDGSSTISFDVVAGLTNIPVARINNLSGSGDIVGNNWSGSVGVG